MTDLRRRVEALEKGRDPKGCLDCAIRRLAGGPDACPNGAGCSNSGRSIEDHIRELEEASAAGEVL